MRGEIRNGEPPLEDEICVFCDGPCLVLTEDACSLCHGSGELSVDGGQGTEPCWKCDGEARS